MVKNTIIEGVEYYEVYDPVTNTVGDIFTDWREIPAQLNKLRMGAIRALEIKKEVTIRKWNEENKLIFGPAGGYSAPLHQLRAIDAQIKTLKNRLK